MSDPLTPDERESINEFYLAHFDRRTPMADRDEIESYIKRVNLALAGYKRGEWVSTWVVKEHLRESIELLRAAAKREAELRAENQSHIDDVNRILGERDGLRREVERLQRLDDISAKAHNANLIEIAEMKATNRIFHAEIAALKAQLARALTENSTEYLRGRNDEQRARDTVHVPHIESLQAKLADCLERLDRHHNCGYANGLQPEPCPTCQFIRAAMEAKP